MIKRIIQRIASGLALLAVTIAAFFVGASLAYDPPPGTEDSGEVVVLAPGETVPAIGPDGEPIVCDDGQVLQVDPLSDDPPPEVSVSGPAGGVDPSTSEVIVGAVPRCGPAGGGSDADPVWIPDSEALSNPQDALYSLGFDGTCDISATLTHTLESEGPLWAPDYYSFDFNATGSCTGYLDDEPIQAAPLSFSFHEDYECGLTSATKGFSGEGSSTLSFSVGTFDPDIDTAIDVRIDYEGKAFQKDLPSQITGQLAGAAVLTGTESSGLSSCSDSTATFTGQLQTLQPLQG
jgi:hypothetical protein